MKVELLEYMGSDLNVVNTARVSFKKKAKWEVGDNDSYDLSEKDQKLIKYLAKEGHYSPFGHCFASFMSRHLSLYAVNWSNMSTFV